MFAVGQNCYTYIYDFYTLSSQQHMGHSGKIGCIDWRQDDSGFCDGCTNGLVAFYDLQ